MNMNIYRLIMIVYEDRMKIENVLLHFPDSHNSLLWINRASNMETIYIIYFSIEYPLLGVISIMEVFERRRITNTAEKIKNVVVLLT